jgi:hypothetical protein
MLKILARKNIGAQKYWRAKILARKNWSEVEVLIKARTITGLPDGTYFETKNHNLGKFWSVLQWTILVYFMSIW